MENDKIELSKVAEIFLESEERIEGKVFDRAVTVIMQVKDNMRNSNEAMQERMEKTILKSMGELRDIVNTIKESNVEKFNDYEKRLIALEERIWPRWHLYAMYSIVALLIFINFFLSVK